MDQPNPWTTLARSQVQNSVLNFGPGATISFSTGLDAKVLVLVSRIRLRSQSWFREFGLATRPLLGSLGLDLGSGTLGLVSGLQSTSLPIGLGLGLANITEYDMCTVSQVLKCDHAPSSVLL